MTNDAGELAQAVVRLRPWLEAVSFRYPMTGMSAAELYETDQLARQDLALLLDHASREGSWLGTVTGGAVVKWLLQEIGMEMGEAHKALEQMRSPP